MSVEAGLPSGFSRAELQVAGYQGWRTWDQLRAASFEDIPREPGCYVVFRPGTNQPDFLEGSAAGHFKGRDPSVARERLAAEWVPGAHVVYLGKADELRGRLRTYGRFGAGEPVAHWGGRLIWQLADADRLLVAWHVLPPGSIARDLERSLLARFADLHDGRRPLANLTG